MIHTRSHSSHPVQGSCFRLLLPALLALLSAACASIPEPAPELPPSHDQVLESLNAWTLRGRLNIRGENEARTINILWEQAADAFDINLSGTLGLGTVLLYGDDRGLTMEQGNEAPVYAGSLDDLSADLMGYDYPARHLLFWIRGLPAPESGYAEERDESGLLSTLRQDGWFLQFDRYEALSGVYLPGRIRLDNGSYRLTFLIQDWELAL